MFRFRYVGARLRYNIFDCLSNSRAKVVDTTWSKGSPVEDALRIKAMNAELLNPVNLTDDHFAILHNAYQCRFNTSFIILFC